MKNILYFILLLFIYISCNNQSQKLPFNVIEANKLIQIRPDSIANLLESMNPELLSDSDKADYWFLLTQTHKRQERSLINDSLINFSVDYYKANNSPYLTTAYRLAAYQVNWSDDKNSEEEELLLKATETAKTENDTTETYKVYESLADLYFKMGEYAKCITASVKAIEFASKPKEAWMLYRTGINYAVLNKYDSCFLFMDRALEVAQNANEKRLAYDILRNYADFYNYINEGQKAIDIINRINDQSSEKYYNKYFTNFTYLNAWLNLNQLDSAKYYINYLENNKVASSDPRYFIESFITAMFRSVYNEKLGLPVEMLTIGLHSDIVMNSIRNKMSIDRERLFYQNKLAEDKNKLKFEKQQQLQTYLFIIIAILIIASIIIFIYQRKILQKERLIQLAKEHLQQNTVKLYENETIIKENEGIIKDLTSQLEENSDVKEQLAEIEQIQEVNKSLLKQNDLLNKEIDKYTSILTKQDAEKTLEEVNRQNIVLQDREKFLLDQLINNHDILSQLKYSPKYINEEQWVTIVNIINVLYNNYTVRLQSDFPNLTEDDIKYCCLIKLRLSTTTIATLMAVSPPSVTKRKQRIKEKMSKQNSDILFKEQSLENYLWSC